MPKRRTKLAPGIWRDASGVSVVVRCGPVYAEKRYHRATPLWDLKEKRIALQAELFEQRNAGTLRQRRRKSTLKEDAKDYLKAVRGLETYKERRHHIDLWVERFGDRDRRQIQPHEIQAERDRWKLEGKAASTINHYLRALSNLYKVLDPKGENPVRHVPELDEPDAIPRAVPRTIIDAIFAAMPESQTRARLRVLCATGISQSTFAHLTEADVDLESGTVRLPKRKKGQGAAARLLPLTADGIDAFKEVAKLEAWGKYSTSSVYKSFRLACDKVEAQHNEGKKKKDRIDLSHLRPYDLRHTFGTDLSLATDGNTATIALFMGHSSPAQADRYRYAAIPQHLREAAAKLDARRLVPNP